MSENGDNARTVEEAEAFREAQRQRLIREVNTALRADPDVRAWPPTWEREGRIDYFYRTSSVLTRDSDLPRVRDTLLALGAYRGGDSDSAFGPDGTDSGTSQGGHALVNGITQLAARVRESQHTPDLVGDLDERLGSGVATHDHAFVITYNTVCPASEPEVVITPQRAANPVAVRDELWPREGDPGAGRDVRVAVVDTGLIKGAAAWAPWVEGVLPNSQSDIEDPDQLSVDSMERKRDGYADPYAGHGTFVSGVVRCIAPAATIVVDRILGISGFALESSLITQLHDALSRSPDVINMSAGGYTRRNIPSIAFQNLWEQRLSQLGGVVLVAAAGNDGRTDPFWPAAFPWCVGVGSMSQDGQRRSWFSNHGAWVDVYAPGEGIVNAYARLKYMTVVDGEIRDTSAGIVRWSGTSFATPIVAGLIAARMSRTGENARQAAEALLVGARYQFRPGVGPRLFP